MIISIVVNGVVCVFYTSLVSEYKYYCANTIYTSANNCLFCCVYEDE